MALVACEEMHADLVVSGHQDGVLRAWDPRDADARPASAPPASVRLGAVPPVRHRRSPSRRFAVDAHRGAAGVGAASCVVEFGDGRLASCGADKRVVVTDARAAKPVLAFDDHRDFPYCLAVLDDLIFTGAGDGALLCHDATRGACLWGLGAGLGAVRAVDARPDQLVAAGDDGNVLLWALSS